MLCYLQIVLIIDRAARFYVYMLHRSRICFCMKTDALTYKDSHRTDSQNRKIYFYNEVERPFDLLSLLSPVKIPSTEIYADESE